MPAYIPSLNLAGVKIVNVHPGNRTIGLPTVMALLVLIDPATGYPRALLNATRLTDLRTGAAGAVAARHLARAGRNRRRDGRGRHAGESPDRGAGLCQDDSGGEGLVALA